MWHISAIQGVVIATRCYGQLTVVDFCVNNIIRIRSGVTQTVKHRRRARTVLCERDRMHLITWRNLLLLRGLTSGLTTPA